MVRAPASASVAGAAAGSLVEPLHHHLRITRSRRDTLRREEDLRAPAADRTPDELLVAADAVGVSGIEKIDAELDRAMDRGDRLVVVALAVALGHAHAAEAER